MSKFLNEVFDSNSYTIVAIMSLIAPVFPFNEKYRMGYIMCCGLFLIAREISMLRKELRDENSGRSKS